MTKVLKIMIHQKVQYVNCDSQCYKTIQWNTSIKALPYSTKLIHDHQSINLKWKASPCMGTFFLMCMKINGFVRTVWGCLMTCIEYMEKGFLPFCPLWKGSENACEEVDAEELIRSENQNPERVNERKQGKRSLFIFMQHQLIMTVV